MVALHPPYLITYSTFHSLLRHIVGFHDPRLSTIVALPGASAVANLPILVRAWQLYVGIYEILGSGMWLE